MKKIITGKSKCGFSGQTTFDCAVINSVGILEHRYSHCKTPFIAFLKTMRSYKKEFGKLPHIN